MIIVQPPFLFHGAGEVKDVRARCLCMYLPGVSESDLRSELGKEITPQKWNWTFQDKEKLVGDLMCP